VSVASGALLLLLRGKLDPRCVAASRVDNVHRVEREIFSV
jgi:hypothetical protein